MWKTCGWMVKILWRERQQIFFSLRLQSIPYNSCEWRLLRTLFRLIRIFSYVEFALLRTSLSQLDYIVRHRFERIIAGRCYQIEVAKVDDKRWRAHIMRAPGVPTAMMPFYGETPDEAAKHLSDWLIRAHARAATIGSS